MRHRIKEINTLLKEHRGEDQKMTELNENQYLLFLEKFKSLKETIIMLYIISFLLLMVLVFFYMFYQTINTMGSVQIAANILLFVGNWIFAPILILCLVSATVCYGYLMFYIIKNYKYYNERHIRKSFFESLKRL